MKKKLIAILLVLTLSLGSTAIALSTQRTINVDANLMTVNVNGKQITGDNFLYNGTTYIPIRAAAESLGATVQFIPETHTAIIQSSSNAAANNFDKSLVYELDLYHCIQKYLDYLNDGCFILIDQLIYNDDRSQYQSFYTSIKNHMQEEYNNIEYIFQNTNLQSKEEATELFYSLKTCHDSIMAKINTMSNLNAPANTLEVVKNSLFDLTVSLTTYTTFAEYLYAKTLVYIG